MQNVKQEITGRRDLSYSRRHRLYGYDCACTDIDFLEYDHGKPRAITEMKREGVWSINTKHPTIRAQVCLADAAQIPHVICRHALDFSWFQVIPCNRYARVFVPNTVKMSQIEWVKLLYGFRGRTPPNGIIDSL